MQSKSRSELPPLDTDPKLIINKAILLLAELRTHYSLMRTGIALFGFAVTFLAFIIATAGNSGIFRNPLTSSLVIGLLTGIAIVGAIQMQSARIKVTKATKLLNHIKKEFPDVGYWIV